MNRESCAHSIASVIGFVPGAACQGYDVGDRENWVVNYWAVCSEAQALTAQPSRYLQQLPRFVLQLVSVTQWPDSEALTIAARELGLRAEPAR